jgi:hypothetical protein
MMENYRLDHPTESGSFWSLAFGIIRMFDGLVGTCDCWNCPLPPCRLAVSKIKLGEGLHSECSIV